MMKLKCYECRARTGFTDVHKRSRRRKRCTRRSLHHDAPGIRNPWWPKWAGWRCWRRRTAHPRAAGGCACGSRSRTGRRWDPTAPGTSFCPGPRALHVEPSPRSRARGLGTCDGSSHLRPCVSRTSAPLCRRTSWWSRFGEGCGGDAGTELSAAYVSRNAKGCCALMLRHSCSWRAPPPTLGIITKTPVS